MCIWSYLIHWFKSTGSVPHKPIKRDPKSRLRRIEIQEEKTSGDSNESVYLFIICKQRNWLAFKKLKSHGDIRMDAAKKKPSTISIYNVNKVK